MNVTKPILFGCVIAGIFAYAGFTAYETVATKARAQASSLGQLSRWKSEYESLRPFQAKWDQLLPASASINSLYDLRGVVNFEQYGLQVDLGTLALTVSPIMREGVPLLADRVCLTTSGQPGVVATAANIYPTLIAGLDGLARRKDIEISNLTLTSSGQSARAIFPLCVRFHR